MCTGHDFRTCSGGRNNGEMRRHTPATTTGRTATCGTRSPGASPGAGAHNNGETKRHTPATTTGRAATRGTQSLGAGAHNNGEMKRHNSRTVVVRKRITRKGTATRGTLSPVFRVKVLCCLTHPPPRPTSLRGLSPYQYYSLPASFCDHEICFPLKFIALKFVIATRKKQHLRVLSTT